MVTIPPQATLTITVVTGCVRRAVLGRIVKDTLENVQSLKHTERGAGPSLGPSGGAADEVTVPRHDGSVEVGAVGLAVGQEGRGAVHGFDASAFGS